MQESININNTFGSSNANKNPYDYQDDEHSHSHIHQRNLPYHYELSDKDAQTRRNRAAEEKFRYVSQESKVVFYMLIVGIVLSVIIMILGFVAAAKTSASTSYILVAFGIIAAGVFGFSMYAQKVYTERVDYYLEDTDNHNPEHIDQSKERTMLNIAIYLIMLIFLIFLIISVGCFAFQDSARNEIRSISSNQNKWNRYFGKASYDSVMKSVTTTLYIAGAVSLILCAYVATLLYFMFNVLGVYRSWQTIVEFVCVVFFMLGFVFLYLAVYSEKYKEVANVDKAMPQWIPDALLGTSVLAIVIAIFGFVAAKQENIKLLQIFSLVIALFTAVILVLSIGGALYAGRFQQYFSTRCTKILDYINQDYLINYAQCDRKYVYVAQSIDGMQCPKERIVTAWEVNLGIDSDKQVDAYGCIDAGCCVATYGYIKTKIDYLALIAFCLFTFGCLMVAGSCYMLSKLERHEEHGTKDESTNNALYAIAGVTAIIMIVFIGLIPSPPTPSPLAMATVDSSPKNNSNVNMNTVLQPNITKFANAERQTISLEMEKNTSIAEDTTGCEPNCVSLGYYYEVSSNDGTFVPNQDLLNNANISVVINKAQGTGMIVGFNGTASNLDNFTNYFTFIHNCPLNPAVVEVRVIATARSTNPRATTLVQVGKKKLVANKRVLSLLQTGITTQASGKLKQNANPSNNNTSDVSSNSSFASVIDVSKLRPGQSVKVLDTDIDYSFVNTKNPQIIFGNVVRVTGLNTTTPVATSNVKITPLDFAQCTATQIAGDANGYFATGNLYPLTGEVPTTYKVEVSSPGLITYTTKVKIGGIGSGTNIDLGLIKLWPSGMVDLANVGSLVINSINNQPLSGVTVSAYAGYMDFANAHVDSNGNTVLPEDSNQAATDTSLLQLTQNATAGNRANNTNTTTNVAANPDSNSNNGNAAVFISNITSDDNGTFIFNDLSPNTYTIVLNKEGFYREVYYIDVLGNFTQPMVSTQMTPTVEEGKLRFVLSWPNGPKDVDIHSSFKISRFSNCEVYFGKKECAGVILDTDNFAGGRNGVETITINDLGRYYYTFYVHKYQDISNGQAAGDNFVAGSDIDQSVSPNATESSTVPDNSLSLSGAKVSVYSYGFKAPIYQIIVPATATPATTLDASAGDAYDYNYWLAFCLNGYNGIDSLSVVNKLADNKPSLKICENLYTNQAAPAFVQLSSKKTNNRMK